MILLPVRRSRQRAHCCGRHCLLPGTMNVIKAVQSYVDRMVRSTSAAGMKVLLLDPETVRGHRGQGVGNTGSANRAARTLTPHHACALWSGCRCTVWWLSGVCITHCGGVGSRVSWSGGWPVPRKASWAWRTRCRRSWRRKVRAACNARAQGRASRRHGTEGVLGTRGPACCVVHNHGGANTVCRRGVWCGRSVYLVETIDATHEPMMHLKVRS